MAGTTITLTCGCVVELRETWEYGCAGDCHPGQYVMDSGEITTACEAHTPSEGCPYDCDHCHDYEDCECPNCLRMKQG